jgi:putative phosphoesterase
VKQIIGLISDTHGLLRPEAVEALRGVSLILHAGDVGGADIIAALETIAPVKAVRGNTDGDSWGRKLPLFETVNIGPVWIYLHHGHLDPDMDFKAAGMNLVMSGHTHVPLIERRKDILYINPGSAGPRRFSLPVTVARLTLDGGMPAARIIEL